MFSCLHFPSVLSVSSFCTDFNFILCYIVLGRNSWLLRYAITFLITMPAMSLDSNIVITCTSCDIWLLLSHHPGNWTKDSWIHYWSKGNKPWPVQLDDLEKIGLTSKQVMLEKCIIFHIHSTPFCVVFW